MASSNSSSLFNEYYDSYNEGLEGSIVPNMDSARVNPPYDSSTLYAVSSYAPPYIPNQQNFTELMPFLNDLPSQMGIEPLFSNPLEMASSTSSSYPLSTYYNTFNELVSLLNDLLVQMKVEQTNRPLEMASSSSYSSLATNYNNFNKPITPYPNEMGFMGSIVPNMDSARVNQQYDFSTLNAASSYATPYILNQKNFTELMPFPDDLPSQMGIEPQFSNPLNMASSASTSSSYPLSTYYNTFNELMSIPNDFLTQMKEEKTNSPLKMASTSSYSSLVTNYSNFNKLITPYLNEMGFMETSLGQNEVKIFNGLMPNELPSQWGFSQPSAPNQGLMSFPNDMPSQMGVEQLTHTTSLNELKMNFNTLRPFEEDDIPSITGIGDLDAIDLDFITKE